jgi:hypothetical protein
MRKTLILVIALGALVFQSAYVLADDQAPQGDSSQEVVVKGQLKIKIDAEMPKIEIKTDTNEVAQSIVTTEESFLSISPEDVKDVKASLPDKVMAERPDYHADISSIETQPIFKINPKMPAGIDIDKWSFKVTDSTGGTVFFQKGDGSLPQVIQWDGYDRDGRILKLGSPYWYVLTYMDKAGNPGSVRRETPKEVTALKYKKESKLCIELASKILFEDKRKDRLTDSGKQSLTEVQDYIKMSNNFPVLIQIYSEDKGMSTDQSKSIEKLFTEKMKIPKEFLKFETLIDNSIPKDYRVVFTIN